MHHRKSSAWRPWPGRPRPATPCLLAAAWLTLACQAVGTTAEPAAVASATPTADEAPTNLLLRPRVDLSLLTPESFAVASGLVGPEKIRRPWTEAVKRLPPLAN